MASKTIKSIAPGRVCLFGDHQDYLGLPVIACAIDRHITLTAVCNDSNNFNLDMLDLNSQRSFRINNTFQQLQPRDYLGSAIRVLKRYGCIPSVGYNVAISGTVPMNAGASSSTALTVAWINFLIEAFGIDRKVNSKLIAQIAHESEVLEHGEPGGIMDQYSIAMGNIVHIATEPKMECKQIGSHLNGLVIGESGIPKETIGLLARLKSKALQAVKIVKEHRSDFKLAEARLEDFDLYSHGLPRELQPYLLAALKSHMLTNMALREMKKESPDMVEIGKLMTDHHLVLKDILRTTVPKIDVMAAVALGAGALGVKILGSGGGGSIAVLAPGKEDQVVHALLDAGAVNAYQVSVDPGARAHTIDHANTYA